MKSKLNERVLPPNFKFVIQQPIILRLTFKERLKVLLGYRIDIDLHLWTEHGPGKVSPVIRHKVTEEL